MRAGSELVRCVQVVQDGADSGVCVDTGVPSFVFHRVFLELCDVSCGAGAVCRDDGVVVWGCGWGGVVAVLGQGGQGGKVVHGAGGQEGSGLVCGVREFGASGQGVQVAAMGPGRQGSAGLGRAQALGERACGSVRGCGDHGVVHGGFLCLRASGRGGSVVFWAVLSGTRRASSSGLVVSRRPRCNGAGRDMEVTSPGCVVGH